MTRSAPYLRWKWLVVACCLQSAGYLVTCAFPMISTMEEVVVVVVVVVERERERGSHS